MSMKAVVEKYESFFVEMMDEKKIAFSITIKADWQLLIHPLLADMLVSNLFSNAIRYNKQQGKIIITIRDGSFEIINTSTMHAIGAEKLFHRFAKSDTATGNGLGLAIVKEICDANNIAIQYSFDNTYHQFKLTPL